MSDPTIPDTLPKGAALALGRVRSTCALDPGGAPFCPIVDAERAPLRALYTSCGGRGSAATDAQLVEHARRVIDRHPASGYAQPAKGGVTLASAADPATHRDDADDAAPAVDASGDDASALADAIRRIAGTALAPVDEGRVIELIREHAGPRETTVTHLVRVERSADDTVTIDGAHARLADVLAAVTAGVNVMLVGPAGSGKTHLAEQCADALDRPFHSTGAVDDAFTLLGFIRPDGVYTRTAFRDAFEHGGVFLFDEIDGSAPEALVAFNAALANGSFPFPDGAVRKHPDFVAIAAANTYGHGADRTYVGRYQLDGATLDRFASVTLDYDEALERRLALAAVGDDAKDAAGRWVDYVQRVRAVTRDRGVRMIVSMRASINGARLLAAGWEPDAVLEAVLWKGASADDVASIRSAVGSAA